MAAKSSSENPGPLALIIDDEEAICEAIAGVLEDEGWHALAAHSGQRGIADFKTKRPDLVFLDVWMPGMDGIETLQNLKALDADVPIVVMSGHGTMETAVKAIKLGAFDFLEKPLSLDKILPMIEHAGTMRRRKQHGASQITLPERLELIGESSAMKKIHNQISLLAPRNTWILITGESGTGKELVAKNIHAQSTRADKPFIAVNCRSLPKEQIEAELFGNMMRPFADALETQQSKFELAHNGTLFLDEIAELSLPTQARILKVLQEQKVTRIGDDKSIQVDVRVIAATHKNLHEEIRRGHFREDLFYRLNVMSIHLPSLCDREGDAVILADFFLTQMAIERSEQKKILSAQVADVISSLQFSENVRSLRELCMQLCVRVKSTIIQLDDLPESVLAGMR